MIFLAIQNTYSHLHLALLQDSSILDTRSCDKKEATSKFISLLSDLLTHNNQSLSSCSFIAVNYGPGPFTTLRVVISSVNGLSFTHQIPLVAVDALEAMALEHKNPRYPHTVIMLNAFGGDAYYSIISNHLVQESGVLSAQAIKDKVAHGHDTVRFIGNGVPLYKDTILTLGARAYIPDPLPEYCSLSSIGALGLQQFKAQSEPVYQLMPRYIKKGLGQL